MKKLSIISHLVIVGFVICFTTNCLYAQASQQKENKRSGSYQCLPCGYDCDNDSYNEPGECVHCHMQLVRKASVTFKSIEPSAICNYISKHPGVILLDVRTREEFAGKSKPDFGTLKNAINIPVQELQSRLGSINNLKSKEIIVYCSHSHRSPAASYMLTQNGFSNVTNMTGGMSVMNDNTCKIYNRGK